MKKALADIAYSPGYRYAVQVDGALRHNLDGSDAGPVSFEHRADARRFLRGDRWIIAADIGL